MVALAVTAPVTCSWWTQTTTVDLSSMGVGDKGIIWPSSSLNSSLSAHGLFCWHDWRGFLPSHPVAGCVISFFFFHYRPFPLDLALTVSSFTRLSFGDSGAIYFVCRCIQDWAKTWHLLASPSGNVYSMKKWLSTSKHWNPSFSCFLLKPKIRLRTLEGLCNRMIIMSLILQPPNIFQE